LVSEGGLESYEYSFRGGTERNAEVISGVGGKGKGSGGNSLMWERGRFSGHSVRDRGCSVCGGVPWGTCVQSEKELTTLEGRITMKRVDLKGGRKKRILGKYQIRKLKKVDLMKG